MPLAFTAHPGLGMAAIRVARDDHPVDATGPAMGLRNMIPAIPAVPQANGALRYPLVFVYWLILPIVHWGADIPGGTVLADFIVGVERCGTALERCILGGLDMSPCTISVARARIKRLGVRIFQLDPAPFTVMFADLYPTTPTPPVAGVVMPAAHPDTAHASPAALSAWMCERATALRLFPGALASIDGYHFGQGDAKNTQSVVYRLWADAPTLYRPV